MRCVPVERERDDQLSPNEPYGARYSLPMRWFDFVTEHPGSNVTNFVAERVTQLLFRVCDLRGKIDARNVGGLVSVFDSAQQRLWSSISLARSYIMLLRHTHFFQLALPAVFLSLLFQFTLIPCGSPGPVDSSSASRQRTPSHRLRKTERSSSRMSCKGNESLSVGVKIRAEVVVVTLRLGVAFGVDIVFRAGVTGRLGRGLGVWFRRQTKKADYQHRDCDSRPGAGTHKVFFALTITACRQVDFNYTRHFLRAF
jgi:hypothetical protein